MIEDDRATEIEPGTRAAAFAVAPVRRRRGAAGLLVVAAVIALAAFIAGMAIASGAGGPVTRLPAAVEAREPADLPEDTSAAGADVPPGGASASPASVRRGGPGDPSALPQAAPGLGFEGGGGPGDSGPGGAGSGGAGPDGAPGPGATAAPGSSLFLAGFEPAAVLAQVDPDRACETGPPLEKAAPRTRVDGPRLTFQRSWLVYCTIPADERQAFLVDLFEALRPAIPAETYSYGTTLAGAGNALFPYADRPMAGTVAVHADAAGPGLAIVVVVEEWRTG